MLRCLNSLLSRVKKQDKSLKGFKGDDVGRYQRGTDLFLFNLLPIPALDGGRGAMLAFEGISRRRLAPKVDAVVNAVGFFALIGMLLIITIKEALWG